MVWSNGEGEKKPIGLETAVTTFLSFLPSGLDDAHAEHCAQERAGRSHLR